jgi:hypothetical protein
MMISCPECSKEISDAAPSCPHCGIVTKPSAPPTEVAATTATAIFLIAAALAFLLALFTPRIIAVLPILAAVILAIISLVRRERFKAGAIAVIVFSIGLFALSASNLSSPGRSASSATGPNGTAALSFSLTRCEQDSDYMIAEGTVTNDSGDSLKDVEAVVSFNDSAGNFITSDDAIIDYNPILTGQTSPFKVMASYNPAMASCSVAFKELMGGEISSVSSPK